MIRSPPNVPFTVGNRNFCADRRIGVFGALYESNVTVQCPVLCNCPVAYNMATAPAIRPTATPAALAAKLGEAALLEAALDVLLLEAAVAEYA